MITVNEAVAIINEQTPRMPVERIELSEALGRILAEDVVADSDLPAFNRAQMDGYAVRSADLSTVPARLQLVGESAAGKGWHNELRPGEAVRIMTGAPVPVGADSVQQVEVTRESDGNVEIDKPTQPGQFIASHASEIREGETVLRAGEEINAASMAALASFGYAQVAVAARPRVTVLSTGTELVPVDAKPGADQIRDSNSYTIASYAILAGALVKRLPLAGDDQALLQREIQKAVDRSDMLVLSGGVSMGVYDLTKAALRALETQIFFERVSLKPGKPTVFGRLDNSLVFGLPGNPVSVSVTFNLFARTALRAMQGASGAAMSFEHAILSGTVKGALERESYLPARLSTTDAGELIAEPLKSGGSSDFVAFTRATALINVPQGEQRLEAGTRVRIVRLPG